MSTYTNAAEKLALLLERREVREDEGKIVVFTKHALDNRSADYRKVSDLIHENDASENFVFEEVFQALCTIADEGFETVEDGLGYYCEADIYTCDLLKWLAGSVYHVYYISEVLEEYGKCGNDGFKLIGVAQEIAKQEIWGNVLNLVRDVAEGE